MEWISVKDQLPPQGIKIKIKADYPGSFVEAECIFKIYNIDKDTEAWGWTLNKDSAVKYGTLRPTHWMLLPEPPKEWI